MCMICGNPEPVHQEWIPAAGAGASLAGIYFALLRQRVLTLVHNLKLSFSTRRRDWVIGLGLMLAIVVGLSLGLGIAFGLSAIFGEPG